MSSGHQPSQTTRRLDRARVKSIFRNLEYLDSGSAAETANALARLTDEQRRFVEHWRDVMLRSDAEVARLFVRRAPQAFALMDRDGVEAWLLQALEQFDQRGLGWAVEVLNSADRFAARRAEQVLTLDGVSPLLSRFITGLGGRELRLEAAAVTCTDTATLFLPATVRQARVPGLRLYKAMATHHWAQTRHGTWRPAVLERLLTLPPELLECFAALERLRLDAWIAVELPGLGRDLRDLGGLSAPEGIWRVAARALAEPAVSALDSLHWLERVVGTEPPAPTAYHGAFKPRQVERQLRTRLERERAALRLRLGQLQPSPEPEEDADLGGGPDRRQPRHRKPTEGFTLTTRRGESGNLVFCLQLAEQPIEIPDDLRELLDSIHQDLGAIPDEYLGGIGRRLYDPGQAGGERTTGADGMAGDARTFHYPEWDHTRNRFRPAYCTLREHTVEPGDPDFVTVTRRKHHGLLKSIRRSFEALANAPRLERRQPEGDDIDLDAAVEARVDARHGDEPPAGVYTRLRDDARSIAVLFMVDMSGSTKGWVNEAERESLVLLCEALETIGDRYAIHGFSGRTRLRVDSYRIKTFDERYTDAVRARIAGIRPRAYTRMGTAIRHLGELLKREPARHKLLITLSDGKPEDYGSYTGRYGIEDTRHALLELRRDGVHPFCITIDREGGDYLPYMYGPANYTVIDQVAKLPLKVADIYRRLTS